MNKPLLIALIFISNLALAYDHDTETYQVISELKSWDSHIDVYFENGEEHLCSGPHKTRFMVDPTKDHHRSLLLSAFLAHKKVRLAYSCNEEGYPFIEGVRIK